MNDDDYDLKELVEREANIWACIYRAINRKKDNNEFDEEEELSGFMQVNSMDTDYLQSFQNDQLIPNKNYPNLQVIQEANDSSKLEEDDSFERDCEDPDNLDTCSNLGSSNREEPRNALKKCLSSSNPKLKPRPSLQRRKSKAFQKKLSAYARHEKMSTMTRMNSEKSNFQNLGTLKRSSGEFKAQTQSYQDEEMLVIYYISIVIRLCKFSDGFKAIEEYKKKTGLSKRAQAHIDKLQGVLTLLSEKKEYNEAIKHFEDSLKMFYKIKSSKGRAI